MVDSWRGGDLQAVALASSDGVSRPEAVHRRGGVLLPPKLAAARWINEDVLITGLPATTDDAS